MKNSIVLTLIAVIFSINLYAAWDFKYESDFYLSSKGTNLFQMEDSELESVKKLVAEYNGKLGIDIEGLMDLFEYELVTEERVDEGERFLICFYLDGKKLPRSISKNTNFIWKKLYEDTDIAINVDEDLIFSYNQETLTLSNSINMFFETEELKYYEHPFTVKTSVDFKELFSGEEYQYAYYLDKKQARFITEDKITNKSLLGISVTNPQEVYMIDASQDILSDATTFIYENDLGSISKDLEVLLPEFGSSEIASMRGIKDSYSVRGRDYAYTIVNLFDKELAKQSLVDAIEDFVFFEDRDLELIEDESGSYVELPIIYRRIYISQLEEDKLVLTNNSQVLNRLLVKDVIDKKVEVASNKKIEYDLTTDLTTKAYYEGNIYITVEERK